MIFQLPAPAPVIYEDVFTFIDPAAGGPGSDYGIMSVTRNRGVLVVRCIFYSCLNVLYSPIVTSLSKNEDMSQKCQFNTVYILFMLEYSILSSCNLVIQ